MKEITDYWGGWFAGLTDGEGSFSITKRNNKSLCANYQCRFDIRLRDDDRAILEEIRDTLGIGNIYDVSAGTGPGGNGRPLASFVVTAINDCAALVRFFDKYPLKSKKRRDYEIWQETVIELQRPVDCRDPDMLEYYFQMIKEVRRYDVQNELVKPITIDLQLSIEWGENNVRLCQDNCRSR